MRVQFSLRPRGGQGQGGRASEDTVLALAPSCRSADNVDACWRSVGSTQARSPRNDPPKRVIHGPNYRPPYAAIVVDDKSGFALHEDSADKPRYPHDATCFFEQLDGGKLKLDTPPPISTGSAL